jgi:phage gpG-like protein
MAAFFKAEVTFRNALLINKHQTAPLSSTTLARKSRTDCILTEEGTLADTLHYQLNSNGVAFGSNQEYAAMQQFGGTTSPLACSPITRHSSKAIFGHSAVSAARYY